jgi:hypothetical protein
VGLWGAGCGVGFVRCVSLRGVHTAIIRPPLYAVGVFCYVLCRDQIEHPRTRTPGTSQAPLGSIWTSGARTQASPQPSRAPPGVRCVARGGLWPPLSPPAEKKAQGVEVRRAEGCWPPANNYCSAPALLGAVFGKGRVQKWVHADDMARYGPPNTTCPPQPGTSQHTTAAYLHGRTPGPAWFTSAPKMSPYALQAPALGQTFHQQRLRCVPRQARLRVSPALRRRLLVQNGCLDPHTHSKTQRMCASSANTTRPSAVRSRQQRLHGAKRQGPLLPSLGSPVPSTGRPRTACPRALSAADLAPAE